MFACRITRTSTSPHLCFHFHPKSQPLLTLSTYFYLHLFGYARTHCLTPLQLRFLTHMAYIVPYTAHTFHVRTPPARVRQPTHLPYATTLQLLHPLLRTLGSFVPCSSCFAGSTGDSFILYQPLAALLCLRRRCYEHPCFYRPSLPTHTRPSQHFRRFPPTPLSTPHTP